MAASIERIRRKLTIPEESAKEFQKAPEINHIKPTGQFEKFINCHPRESFIICGCGSSLNQYEKFDGHVIIGVNDAGRKIPCKYLVVVNEPHTFKWDRWKHVESNDSEYVFTHLPNLPLKNKDSKVVINLGKPNGTNLDNYGFIDYTTNSPYMACIIAYQMGARKIGLIGVDFTLNHFFGETGSHQVMRAINLVLEQYANLGKALSEKGIRIANLSNESVIESWPRMTLEEFETI
jgi:hypothetical protein